MNIERRRKLADASRMVYYPAEPQSKSISLPIYMSANFEYDSDSYRRVLDGDRRGVNIYSRCGNPSEYAFDDQMALIANADACLATASGMAAIATLLFGMLKAGDHIVSDWTTYSSTHEFSITVLQILGWQPPLWTPQNFRKWPWQFDPTQKLFTSRLSLTQQ